MIAYIYPLLILLTGAITLALKYNKRINEEDRFKWIIPAFFYFCFFIASGLILFFVWPASTSTSGLGAVAISVTSVLYSIWLWVVFTAVYAVVAVILLMSYGKKNRHLDGVSSGVTITLALLGVLVLGLVIML
ncbi:MAG: hypothetical protein ACK40M_01225 [Flavobacteriales bacterium]|nr:hypothetical protein [Flavobacteriales bacterium]HRE73807.1 hypothetical protein [Flavobacteriales bacterium]HRE95710.1 hypothetical protein [Flavobacteriales bacterium]HRJ36427.1 hypothetical protein [Flavobacteriales bacterium]HRJ39177.1 hypothetical protein [Flavobacteriales bacterium]